MAGFNFANRADIERTLALIKLLSVDDALLLLTTQGVQKQPELTKGWIFYTPAGGISARSGVACGSAECTPYYIDTDGDLTELTDNDGASQTKTVYHIGASAVGGERYIQAKNVFGVFVADMEDCG